MLTPNPIVVNKKDELLPRVVQSVHGVVRGRQKVDSGRLREVSNRPRMVSSHRQVSNLAL